MKFEEAVRCETAVDKARRAAAQVGAHEIEQQLQQTLTLLSEVRHALGAMDCNTDPKEVFGRLLTAVFETRIEVQAFAAPQFDHQVGVTVGQ